MKKCLTFLSLIICFTTNAQNLPTKPANGFAFPIGSKFTIQMHRVDSVNFDYSIIAFESFTEIVDTWNNDHLFKKTVENNGTIEFYFCLGTTGKTKKDRNKNMKVLLLMKNRTEYSFSYNSDIQIREGEEFKSTSNVGTFSGAKGTEIWPHVINQIGLNGFKVQ